MSKNTSLTPSMSTRFRTWMDALVQPRGDTAEWPYLLRELLAFEFERERQVDKTYRGDVFIDRDEHPWNRATVPEKRAVYGLYHLCKQDSERLIRIGDEHFLLLGYEWPNQGVHRGRRADLVGMTLDGGLVVFECKLAAHTSHGPFAALLEGLDYLACLTSASNFRKLSSKFRSWPKENSGVLIPGSFRDVVPTLSARHEVVVMAPRGYFERYGKRSERGHGLHAFSSCIDAPTTSVCMRFAVSDFSSAEARWF